MTRCRVPFSSFVFPQKTDIPGTFFASWLMNTTPLPIPLRDMVQDAARARAVRIHIGGLLALVLEGEIGEYPVFTAR